MNNIYAVRIPANVYAGKYYDFRTVSVLVAAYSELQACTIVNRHANIVLGHLDKRRGSNKRRVVRSPIDKNVFFKESYHVTKITASGPCLTESGEFLSVTSLEWQ